MLIDLEVTTLTHGGRGLGHHEGKAVFVGGTAPGDRVRCRMIRSHARFAEAEPVEFLKLSPLRRVPPCPVFHECGGCQWQHLPYDIQLAWKDQLFREQLLRSGVATPEVLLPIVVSPAEWGYRNRLQFKCRQTAQGFVAGFYRQGSHYVVDVSRCLLAEPSIHECFASLRSFLPRAPHPAAIPQVDISCSDDKTVTVLLHVLPEACDDLCGWLTEIAQQGGFNAAVQCGRKDSINTVWGKPGMVTTVDDPPLQLQASIGGFAQVNPMQNRKLVDAVIHAAGLSGGERLLDLYCGVGNFSLALARRAAAVVGVESYAPAIRDATDNALRHGISNATFHAESAEGAALRHGDFDMVVLDPPRTGAYPVMRDLLALRPQKIIYVSCDPATLVRDLQPLVHGGFVVRSSQPFDLFPQTWHTESLTVLERRP